MPFNTYIDDRAMIPVLLEHDWMIWKRYMDELFIRNIHVTQEDDDAYR